jgi:hypothetical protein
MISAASNGSQTLRLPLERNLAGARGPRQMPRYLIFCASAAISLRWRYTRVRLNCETLILGFGQRLMRRLGGSLAARLVSSSLGLLRSTPLLISRLALDGGQYAARRQPQWSQR